LRRGADFFLARHFDSGSGGPYHARAMGNPLRDRRTPSELAASGQVIEFTEKISEFEQLAGIIADDLETLDPDKLPPDWRDKVVAGRLSFGFADAHKHLPMLQGKVAATVDGVCQRCLGAMQLPLVLELRLLFGSDESAALSDDGYEFWELEEDKLRPLDLVEEALIMAMPLTAMHVDNKVCVAPGKCEEDPGEKLRPFALLKSQMGNDN
jgi:uncharacterized metal-binding protein YceD (DUF177 family)